VSIANARTHLAQAKSALPNAAEALDHLRVAWDALLAAERDGAALVDVGPVYFAITRTAIKLWAPVAIDDFPATIRDDVDRARWLLQVRDVIGNVVRWQIDAGRAGWVEQVDEHGTTRPMDGDALASAYESLRTYLEDAARAAVEKNSSRPIPLRTRTHDARHAWN